jgi:hypothetical protein
VGAGPVPLSRGILASLATDSPGAMEKFSLATESSGAMQKFFKVTTATLNTTTEQDSRRCKGVEQAPSNEQQNGRNEQAEQASSNEQRPEDTLVWCVVCVFW